MRIRKAARIALFAWLAALLAGGAAVGCGLGFGFGLGDDPPEDEGLIKDLVLLYEPPETATAAAPPTLTPTRAAPPRTVPAVVPPRTLSAALATPESAAAAQPVAAAPAVMIAGSSFENEPPNAALTYYYGDEIKVSFSFVSAVAVVGQPRAQLEIGAATRDAVFTQIAENDPTTVHFAYTVQSDDLDTDGIVLLGRYVADANNYICQRGMADTCDAVVQAVAIADVPFPHGGGMVDGQRRQPNFAATGAGLHLAYAPQQSIAATELPAASGGNGPLTYELHQCPSGSSDQAGPAGIPFGWLAYHPPGPDDEHGGRLAPVAGATPTAVMDAVCFILTAQDADGDRTDDDAARLRFTVAVGNDYDVDDDGLVEVDNPAKLDAIRWDLDGDGAADNADNDAAGAAEGYAAAFPNPLDGMGCPAPAGCAGYELTQNLDLDTDADDGTDWTPLGSPAHPFAAVLDGQGYAIANLSINRSDAGDAAGGGALGLLGAIGTAGVVRNLGLTGVTVHYAGAAADVQVGSIAGSSRGAVVNCYAAGAVIVSGAGASAVGGLIGRVSGGTVSGSYAVVDVSGGSRVGGLVGVVGPDGGAVTDSYAMGTVSGGANAGVGGLVGELGAAGRIVNSYAVGAVSGGGEGTRGGLVGVQTNGATVMDSYYDAGSTGQPAAVDTDSDDAGQTTRALQSPTGNTGLYREWDAAQWDFGTARQYPALQADGGLVPGQRQVALQVDNWDYPVADEPVEVVLMVSDAAGVSWQWQSSAAGRIWTDIADATAYIYVPDADDAADGGKYLRARVVFTAGGVRQSVATVNTAKVAAAAAAELGTVIFVPQVAVGSKLEHRLPDGDISAPAWRWQRCDDAGMRQNCVWIPDGVAAYTPESADVGKYLRAYVYYRDGWDWQRAEYPVIGPVAAAPTDP